MSPCTRLIKRMLLRSENESKNSLITELTFCVCLDLLEADIMERREYAEERRQMIRAFKASVRLEREAGRSDAAPFGGITIALLYKVGESVMLPVHATKNHFSDKNLESAVVLTLTVYAWVLLLFVGLQPGLADWDNLRRVLCCSAYFGLCWPVTTARKSARLSQSGCPYYSD